MIMLNMNGDKKHKASRKVNQFSDRFVQSRKHSGVTNSVEEYSEIKSNLVLAVSKINAKYFKVRMQNDDKLTRFFGDDALAASLTDRISNEFSHLAGVFERSVLPIDVPEMKTTANFILRKIKEKDPDQYVALLQSIGVTKESDEKIQVQ